MRHGLPPQHAVVIVEFEVAYMLGRCDDLLSLGRDDSVAQVDESGARRFDVVAGHGYSLAGVIRDIRVMRTITSRIGALATNL